MQANEMTTPVYLVEECVQFIFAEFSLEVFDLLQEKVDEVSPRICCCLTCVCSFLN